MFFFLLFSIFPLLLHASLVSASTMRVLRNDISLSEIGKDQSGSHAKLVDNRTVELKDFSVCMRFNILHLLGRNQFTPLLTIKQRLEEKPPRGDLRKIWFQIYARYPLNYVAFGYPRAKGSFHSWHIRDPITHKSTVWSTHSWNHFCFSFEKANSFVKFVQNGQMTNINFTDHRVSNATLLPNILQNVYIGFCASGWVSKCSSLGAKFSDLNMWNRPLSDEEMINFTTCKPISLEGSIMNWESAEFSLKNMSEIYEPTETVCESKKPGHIMALESNNFLSHQSLCKKMGGEVSQIASEVQQESFLKEYGQRCQEQCLEHVWTGLWDEKEEGVFTHASKSDNKSLFLGEWAPGEPNGDKDENCVAMRANGQWMDLECSHHALGFCYLEKRPIVKIRGLRFLEYTFDDYYFWTGKKVNARYAFYGVSNTLLSFNEKEGNWKLSLYNPTKNDTFAITKGFGFPYGSRNWTFFTQQGLKDNEGNVIEKAQIQLDINGCKDEEFNCRDGSCISMDNRCDGRVQCQDQSDELDCKILEIDESYTKFLPPAGDTEDSRLSVNVSVEVLHVLNISEVDNFINLQLRVHLMWRDSRLSMLNLKKDSHLNYLTPELAEAIWVPQLVFFNTAERHESINDEKATMVVLRESDFELLPRTALQNGYTFQGANNAIKISRVYSYKYLCTFDMKDYPFDAQRCSALLVSKGNTWKYIKLVAKVLEYVGPVDLTQYFVEDSLIKEAEILQGIKGIKVELIFARRILNSILTTYLPTILICIVSFTTNFYGGIFFEGIVTVNLTSMLLLVTLFTSVSKSLPKTAYIKNMDVWFIVILLMPFLEVFLHTIIDNLREKDRDGKNDINAKEVGRDFADRLSPSGPDAKQLTKHYYQKQRQQKELQFLLFFARFGLPFLFMIFCIGYFVYSNIVFYNAIKQ